MPEHETRITPEIFAGLIKVELSGGTDEDALLDLIDHTNVLPFTLAKDFTLFLGMHPHDVKRHHNDIAFGQELFLGDLFINESSDGLQYKISHLEHNHREYLNFIRTVGCQEGHADPYYEVMMKKIKEFIEDIKRRHGVK
jgi:hypothetical protein